MKKLAFVALVFGALAMGSSSKYGAVSIFSHNLSSSYLLIFKHIKPGHASDSLRSF